MSSISLNYFFDTVQDELDRRFGNLPYDVYSEIACITTLGNQISVQTRIPIEASH